MLSVPENGCSRFSCCETQTLYSNQLIMISEAVAYLKDVKRGHCCCFAAEVKIFRLAFWNLNSFVWVYVRNCRGSSVAAFKRFLTE